MARPDAEAAQVVEAVRRSLPSLDRPRISEERERLLAPIDQASAACYAALEQTARQFERLAQAIESSADEEPSGENPTWDDPSTVRHIEDLKKQT